jgi:uncharacterized membrane protein YfcA
MSFLIGLLSGLFGGLVGLGGGVIMIPLMVGFLKLTQHQAHGTSLVALVFTGLSGAVTYALQGSVDPAASVCLAASGMITARAGAHYANSLPEWVLKRSFGVFLFAVSLLMLAKPFLPHVPGMESGFARAVVLLVAGTIAGFVSGMMGVGGGTIMVPAMVLLAGFGQHLAQGSALLAMVPAGSVGAATHWKLGNVVRKMLLGLITGILAGSWLGATLAHLIPDAGLRIVFATILIWTGSRNARTKRPAIPQRAS